MFYNWDYISKKILLKKEERYISIVTYFPFIFFIFLSFQIRYEHHKINGRKKRNQEHDKTILIKQKLDIFECVSI